MKRIALIPGDGIGKEVIPEGVKVLNAVAKKYNIELEFDDFDFGADRYLKDGHILTDEDIEMLKKYDAIYLGAVGDPRVEPGLLEKGILLKLRFDLDLYINLRPIKLFDEKYCPLKEKTKKDIDFMVIRENTEDLYVGSGGFLRKGTMQEVATQEMIATRFGVERAIRHAFEVAKKRNSDKKTVALCDKSNVLTFAHNLWLRTFEEVAKEYPEIKAEHYYVDAICMKMVRNPEIFDVIVTSNMFGDIITDLGAEIQGGMGTAVSGNINPKTVSMFEPVHGSAPDIAGKGIANPIATILAGAQMMDVLGYTEAGKDIEKAVLKAMEEKETTSDMGGKLSTKESGDVISKFINEI
ncbi:MAG: 3-isopropylmalate dehydrogenase [Fusobacteriia bacterium 4572_132]|nr:MAG: 3-isopropylmalate dehydrogenase [Fusobacteriia bacterium 4572_132]